MTPAVEHRDETTGTTRVQASVIGFVGRFVVVHTIVYFVAGMVFAALFGYRELFASSEYPHFRAFDSPLVTLGPLLQVFRGAIIALAFLPFRRVIMESKRGWLYLFGAQWILLNVAANTTTPGAIEAFIYTDIPFLHHFVTYPEFTLHTLAVSWLFYAWHGRPSKKLNIAFLSVFAIIAALLILGVLVGQSNA